MKYSIEYDNDDMVIDENDEQWCHSNKVMSLITSAMYGMMLVAFNKTTHCCSVMDTTCYLLMKIQLKLVIQIYG
ncbi:hypothetical protein H5410_054061 [Solanum commersonii]|uniref:Uncharacterized protein n=1 Tax=Solanum commersonii TaxID=4109 RepID=A0A9J5X6C8_SOLCO|nr:hypothetical protein H5410_054061 [Solanum commersonii]